MLAGPVRDEPGPVRRQEVEGADRPALVDDSRDRERAPPRREVGGAHPVGGLAPVAGHQGIGRPAVRPQAPAQGQRAAPPHHPARPESPEPFGTLEGGDLGRGQDDRGVACQLQQVAGREIGEDEAGLAVEQDVAERGEEQVAGEVGNRERAVGGDPHEAGLAAAMRDIDLTAPVLLGVGRDEEGVGGRDRGARRLVEVAALLDVAREGLLRVADRGGVAQLDILRAIAEALRDLDPQEAVRRSAEDAVRPVAAAGVQLDAEETDRLALVQARTGRVARIGPRRDREPRRARRSDEARRTGDQRRPGVTLTVDAAGDEERELREEGAVLVGHEVPHDAPADLGHARGDADLFLDGRLARVPWRGLRGLRHRRTLVHDASPVRFGRAHPMARPDR